MIRVAFILWDENDEIDTQHTLYFKTVVEMGMFMDTLDNVSKKKFTYTYATVSVEDVHE